MAGEGAGRSQTDSGVVSSRGVSRHEPGSELKLKLKSESDAVVWLKGPGHALGSVLSVCRVGCSCFVVAGSDLEDVSARRDVVLAAVSSSWFVKRLFCCVFVPRRLVFCNGACCPTRASNCGTFLFLSETSTWLPGSMDGTW